MDKEQNAAIKPMTKSQLARLYGVNIKTFTKWLQRHPEIGSPIGYIYCPKQVRLIFSIFDIPD